MRILVNDHCLCVEEDDRVEVASDSGLDARYSVIRQLRGDQVVTEIEEWD